MSKIETFNKASAKAIGEAIDKLLADHRGEFQERFGVQIKTGNGTFYDQRFTLKLEIAKLDESGKAATKSAEDFRRWSEDIASLGGGSIVAAFELGPECPFEHRGKQYFVEGYRPRSRKYPYVIAEVDDPTSRVCTARAYLIEQIEKATGQKASDGATEASLDEIVERQKAANG